MYLNSDLAILSGSLSSKAAVGLPCRVQRMRLPRCPTTLAANMAYNRAPYPSTSIRWIDNVFYIPSINNLAFLVPYVR